jgi:hypothetical protein
MKRLAVAAALAATLALPAARAGETPQAVLGIDGREGAGRLAWFNPASLSVLPGRKVPLASHTGKWAFSADRSVLAIAAADYPGIRFVNARGMRLLGTLSLRHDSETYIAGLAWARPDRLLVAAYKPEGGFVAVVDPQRRREIRRVDVTTVGDAVAVPGGLALLLGPPTGIGPAQFALVGADGAVRSVAIDRIPIGTVVSQGTADFGIDVREPGFALDRAGRRAFVVGADFTVAVVDLDTLAVTYHAPSTRTLAKNITGPSRQAAWLGNDTLAVSGFDYKGSHDGEPVGLRLVDTRDWSVRIVDAGVGRFGVGEGTLVAGEKVFGFDGTLRYRVDLGTEQWLSVQGQYGYVCGTAQGRLHRVLQLGTGATLRRVTSATAPDCPTLLYGQSSS